MPGLSDTESAKAACPVRTVVLSMLFAASTIQAAKTSTPAEITQRGIFIVFLKDKHDIVCGSMLWAERLSLRDLARLKPWSSASDQRLPVLRMELYRKCSA
jgi:hypothetical protein